MDPKELYFPVQMQKFPGEFSYTDRIKNRYIALGEKEGRLYVPCSWYKQHLFRPSDGNEWNACSHLRKVNSTLFGKVWGLNLLFLETG